MNNNGGLGFWGVVGAVLVALIIFALCWYWARWPCMR